jgi:type III pantothenate kinase
MMLLVDVGNTAIKWGLCKAGELVAADRFVHRNSSLGEQLTRNWTALQPPDEVFIATVAGEPLAEALSAWIQLQWSLTPRFASTTDTACGVTNAYSVAADLGVDRWAALIGAHHHFRDAVCIVDCGTAITVDVLAANGHHLGGLILPGVELLKQVVQKDTAGVKPATQMQVANLLANKTGEGVHGGAVYMAVAAIDRIINDIVATLDQDIELVITGGDAATMLPLLARSAHHDPALVLKGLARLAGEH